MSTHISSLQNTFYKHWDGYSKAPFPKEFEWEQKNAIIDQAMRRSERYLRLKKQGVSQHEIEKFLILKYL